MKLNTFTRHLQACGLAMAFTLCLSAQGQLPATADLGPEFEHMGLSQRQQGGRPTCSVFTMTGALEFALGHHQTQVTRLSPEFLNWAANKSCDDHEDGGFFSDLWKGYEAYGICAETNMPYQAKFDKTSAPDNQALAQAGSLKKQGLLLHWIKEWDVKTGLTDEQLETIKKTIVSGRPVCGGFRWPIHEAWTDHVLKMCPPEGVIDGHSVLLAGYRDDAKQPGGGVFFIRNSGHGGSGEMPYAYAKAYMNDAVWIEAKP